MVLWGRSCRDSDGRERVASLESLDIFAGSASRSRRRVRPEVMAPNLRRLRRGAAGPQRDVGVAAGGAWALGFGRVTLIGLDVDQGSSSIGPTARLLGARHRPQTPPERAEWERRHLFRRAALSGRYRGSFHPAPCGARPVPRRQAHPVRLGRVLHLPVHPADRSRRLFLPQEGLRADGADLDHLPDDRPRGQPGGLLCGLFASRGTSCWSTRWTWSTSTRSTA